MHVTNSQYEVSGKHHIFSINSKPSRAPSTRQRKNSLEKAVFWHEAKVVCCLLTPFLHARVITFQYVQVTDNDLADR